MSATHRSRWIAAGAVLALAVVVIVAIRVIPHRGDSTPLSVDDVRSRFEQSTTSTPGAEPAALPEPGVYVYVTSGRDAVDALQGDHHDYPSTTTITVSTSGCGVVQRWDVLEERWEEWQRCVDAEGHISQPSRTTFDSFFGQAQTDAYTCTGDARPLDAPASTTWAQTCTEGEAREVYTGTVVGAEQRSVGTDSVDTLHVRVSIDNGTPADHQLIDTWYRAGTDLVVAQVADVETSNSSPVGTVHYSESYSMQLTSLTPLE